MASPLNRRTALLTAVAATVPVAAATPTVAAEPTSRLTPGQVAAWTAAYFEAWRTKDAEAAARLFTDDALYEAIPGVAEQTFKGRTAIKTYWRDVTAGQSDVTARHGAPLVTGDRACVEMWVTLRAAGANPDGDDWITLIETNILYFTPDRLCRRNVEYWNMRLGRLAPPAGWGAAR
ncbi:nuclear transport factor 2 family protein [Streptomyces afghaniensis]|uniref:nuclear transport factor 2 family protein n=1 Tax=Streptomyces afghaniensis TaxID=66865 RepID=UPI00277F9AE2|nr:nuclear transport factor 2 family protein [Streptomyces afghaniensis]MDQ1019012.1 uncharacterized protein (TIGR02246 family) [Streptomyces afghaniensis]